MTSRRSGLRATMLTGLVAATALTLVAPLPPAAHAAPPAAPAGLSVANKNSSTPIFSWAKVPRATSYQIQVDNDSGFGSPEFTSTTVNSRAVPVTNLKPGDNTWRVRAVGSDGNSDWSTSTVTVSAVGIPVPTAPGNGVDLAQPQDAPLLRWQGAQGATSYTVEVDGDADFIGAKSYTTKTTSLVVPDPLSAGEYFWRVTAVKSAGILSQPSAASRFRILPLDAPQLIFPPNDVNLPLEDVVLDWAPVPGARSYQVQVATDSGFNTLTANVSNIVGTRYSPPSTYDNNQYWWRVRAVDLNGQPTAWTSSLLGFKRQWPEKPVEVFPLGTHDEPFQMTTRSPYLQWTPVHHASQYDVQISQDPFLTPTNSTTKICRVAGTTHTPNITLGGDPNCNISPGVRYYWRVRATDHPSNVLGIYSHDPDQALSFIWNPTPNPNPFTAFQYVTGLKVAMTGQDLDTGHDCAEVLCDDMPTTPVFSWTEQDGVALYKVYIAEDENFTNLLQPPTETTNTRLAMTMTHQNPAFPESQAGEAYYWYVVPCYPTRATCGPDPVSSATARNFAHQFRKESPRVDSLTVTDSGIGEVTFDWDDYLDTNKTTVWEGSLSHQAARSYRVVVDNDASFASPLDTIVVDQPTYTAFTQLYPEGTLHVRVQAIDGAGNDLPFSEAVTFTKSSAAVALTSPSNGSLVSGTTPFNWTAQALASGYQIEVYRNNDVAFSPGNRLFAATVKNPAYAWNQPIPADPSPYTWRVRRVDASGNLGPWSATGRFTSLGAVPQLLTPGNSTWQPTAGPLFEWSEVGGAATYQLDVRAPGSTSATVNVTTVATAHAPIRAIPTGSYVWKVTAFDAAGKSLGTSPSRSFSVDATPPTIKKVKPPYGKLKKQSLVTVKFSEPVAGVTKKTLFIAPKVKNPKKAKPMKAKVKMNKAKTKATINVKPNFKPGVVYSVYANTKRIKDLRGNALVISGNAVQLGP